jgi:AAA domain
MSATDNKPTTHQIDLSKLPRALEPLTERLQWAVWRWTQWENGRWQKPPFMAMQPERHASTKDASTWSDYATALAAVQAGKADGVTYVLTEDDPFAAIDLDHCRDIDTCSIDVWAQNFLEAGRASYSEVTPSGAGCRIWGLADGATLNKKFTLNIDGKDVAAELFRRTNKALTITGFRLDTITKLTNIDRVIDWAVIWGERRKAAAAEAAVPINCNGFNGNGSGYGVDQIEQIVRTGAPAGKNRSDVFHTIVGHYLGCGWSAEQISEHLQHFPDGIGSRYLREDRLRNEIARSAGKYARPELPLSGNGGWVNGWAVKAPQPSPEPDEEPEQPSPEPEDDPELSNDLNEDDPDDKPPRPDPELPPLYAHGDADPRPLKSWMVKHFIPMCGHGLLSGQWGTGKTFIVFDLAAALGTGQPFLGHAVKRQCGVLLIAAEGADEVRLRLDAVVRAKCGGMSRAPFRWYETAPMLLHKGAVETLIAMAQQADDSLQQEFGLPLGLIVIDTIAACAGYTKTGDENDNAVGQAIKNVLKTVAHTLGCFVLAVDHFGKNLEAGTRGAYSKESAGDLVLACLGEKELSGSVTNTRLAVRKHRGGRQGQEYPFTLRIVEAPEPDEDGEPITTMVVDWQPGGHAQPEPDPWRQCHRQDQQTAVTRLKRELEAALADHGVELSIPPDGPVARIVRVKYYAHTPADGSPEQKGDLRRQKFFRALDWAERKQLIGIEEIGDVTYLRLTRPEPESGEELEA